MSVVVDGPLGWKYQHIASLYFAMHYLSHYEVVSVTIDAPNTEDCQIQFWEPVMSSIQTVEVQAKNLKAGLTAQKFADIITHFEEKRADTNLLSKLADKKIDRVHLIYRGRADDSIADLSVLADRYLPYKKELNTVTQTSLKTLIDCIRQALARSKSPLNQRRNTFNQQLADRLANDEPLFRSVLEKIFVTDQLPSDRLEQEVKTLLEKNFRIPVTNTDICYRKLLDEVESHQGSPMNLSPAIKNVLSTYKAGSVRPIQGYVPRGIEDELLLKLKKQQVLLLTGYSRCGKTQLSREIAFRLIESTGVAHMETNNSNDANRFLSENSTEERLCLLDDPFGQYAEPSSLGHYKHFDNLLTNLPRNQPRYLIATSRREVVDNSSLTKNLSWESQDVTDRTFLLDVWKQLVLRLGIAAKLNNTVTEILNTDSAENLLQAGELDFLARNANRLHSYDPDSVKHFARFDAEDIARLIMQNGNDFTELFALLGLTATTLTGPTLADLSYITGESEEYTPGVFKRKWTSYGRGTKDKEVYSIPTYIALTPLSRERMQLLEEMMDKGYITKLDSVYLFTHSIYQEASRYTLKRSVSSFFQRTAMYAKKAVSSLNPLVALNTIRSLYVFFTYHSSDADRRESILSIAFQAFYSIFISVQDASHLLVVSKYQYLNKEQKKEIFQRLSSGSSHAYYWDNETAFIPPVTELNSYPDLEAMFLPAEKFQELYNTAATGGTIRTREVWLILNYMEKNTRNRKQRISYDPQFLSRFLIYNEAFIREAAAYLIACSYTIGYFEPMLSLFQSEDPFIAFQLIKGCIRAYPYLEEEESKVKLAQLILRAYDNPIVVSRSIPLMTQFGSGYSSSAFDWRDDIAEEAVADMWYLWGEMLPIFFRNLETDVYIHDGRFRVALQESFTKLTQQQQLRILHSWLTWCTAFSATSSRNQFAIALFNYFMGLFKTLPPEERLEISQQLLQLPFTELVFQLVNFLVYHFSALQDIERRFLSKFLFAAKRSIQNVALVTEAASPELLQLLTGSPDPVSARVDSLIERISEQRLTELLIFVFPPDDYCDLDHIDFSIWRKRLYHFLLFPGHPLFLLAIQRVIFDNEHHPATFDDLKPHRDSILAAIFTSPDRSILTTIFNLLLNELLKSNSSTKVLLILFFVHLTEEETNYFGAQLSQYIEAITYTDNLDQIPKSIFRRFIFPYLINSNSILGFSESIARNLAKNKTLSILEIDFLEKFLGVVQLRDYHVIDFWHTLTKSYPQAFSDNLISSIYSIRDKIYAQFEAQSQELQELLTLTLNSYAATSVSSLNKQ